jgi:hypothetical protein
MSEFAVSVRDAGNDTSVLCVRLSEKDAWNGVTVAIVVEPSTNDGKVREVVEVELSGVRRNTSNGADPRVLLVSVDDVCQGYYHRYMEHYPSFFTDGFIARHLDGDLP